MIHFGSNNALADWERDLAAGKVAVPHSVSCLERRVEQMLMATAGNVGTATVGTSSPKQGGGDLVFIR